MSPIVSGGAGGAGGAMALVISGSLAADGTIDIAAIPGTYSSLRLALSIRGTRAAQTSDLLSTQFNGDSGANYEYSFQDWQAGNTGGGTAGATFMSWGLIPAATAAANQWGAAVLEIPNYASSTQFKCCTGIATQGQQTCQGGGVWKATAAITRVTVFGQITTNLLAGTKYWLYGVS